MKTTHHWQTYHIKIDLHVKARFQKITRTYKLTGAKYTYWYCLN